ncbi:septation protein A [Aquincola sp. S2]|uniref:Inner membrane-spanning protein YciB n=1 Tax=Pseudaquabacterium terrae TaxID=2732868 RepID=A0ABX2EJE2_9BURK|nr:septation protein A [Aquabacterium terrae]NRF68729.1 septation protein A [Aquabacterium terrae]
MKLLFDFLPIILFFAAYKIAGAYPDAAAAFATEHLGFLVAGGQVRTDDAPVMLATVVVIIATLTQVGWLKARGRKVDFMLWLSLGLVVVLGGLTIWFHNDTFIKWKPSGLYWAMGLSFWISQMVFGRNLLRLMLGEQITLPEHVWRRLNVAWIAFFGLMGLLNLWVAYSFSRDAWVNFKLFGGVGLMLAFTLAQGFYLAKYIEDEPASPEGATAKSPESS